MKFKKNAIVQISIPAKGWEQENHIKYQSEEVVSLSVKLSQRYAKRVNAQYFLISKAKIFFKHPTWERFQLFEDEWINNFDNILYLDTDVFPWPDAPDIFDFINNKAFNTAIHSAGKTLNGIPSFNAGVFVLNKSCAINMRKYFKKKLWLKKFKTDPNWEDSKELNEIAQKPEIIHHRLSPVWNTKNSPNAYFTHMWGALKKKNPNAPTIIRARNILKKQFVKKIKDYFIPDEDKTYDQYLAKYDHYQEAQRNRALAQVNNWNLAIDIGANIGLWSRDLTNYFDKTICFEPNINCIECLKKNITIEKAIIYNHALGSKNEEKELFTPINSGGSSFIDKTVIGYKSDRSKIYGKWPDGTNQKSVKVKKLDDFKFIKVDFIKIDVQSYEYEVLKGARKTLELNSPILCIEEDNVKNSKAIKFLESLNYAIVDVVLKEHIFKKK